MQEPEALSNDAGILASRTRGLLQVEQLGDVGHSEYDAAWVARVPAHEGGHSAFPDVLEVVQRTQAPDGGWAPDVDYISARILATLASILAVTEFDRSPAARARAEHGARFVRQAWARLDARQELTIGFELLAPTLIRDICGRGLPLGQELAAAEELQHEKLKRLPTSLIYDPHLSASFSLEFLGDQLEPRRAARLRLKNGSIGASVAATAYYAARTHDEASLAYLRDVIQTYGTDNIPYGVPTTLWPTMWVLHLLREAGIDAEDPVKEKALAYIQRSFNANGMTWCEQLEYADSDGTAMALMVLHHEGRRGDWSLLDKFEAPDGFLCFLSERGPSISANAHVLQSMTLGAHPESPRMAQKAARFLMEARQADGFWIDKWHASPYYPTSRAVRSLLAFSRDCPLSPPIEWLLATQRPSGAWGHYARETPEETAYAVHALAAWFDAGHRDVVDAIARGSAYLAPFDGTEPKSAHPQLWISKVLYRPLAVVRCAVLGAQRMAQRITSSVG